MRKAEQRKEKSKPTALPWLRPNCEGEAGKACICNACGGTRLPACALGMWRK
jgi:hypothetical protein